MTSLLREHVDALHAELAATNTLDAESREALVTLLGDIVRLLEQSQQSDAPSGKPIADRLEALAVRFEAKHPALGTTVRQVVDALGKAGI